ncbi:MAG: response regulator transcription factor [Crocosphaera sp.]
MSYILIVEDEPRLAQFIEKGLKKQGFTTLIATNGQDALCLTQKKQFDLVLLDLGLPIMDGWTFLQHLRNDGNQIPVIIMTALDQIEVKNKGKRYNIKKYISKPFRFQDLVEKVNVSLSLY